MISNLLRCLRLEKMIWRWGKSGVISNVEFGMLLILPCVVLASFLSTTVASHHSPPVPSAPVVSSITSILFASGGDHYRECASRINQPDERCMG
ncbi:unnamed protein product [Sphagnum jensenii]|uniref:Uncharacterized protein n=1 Tax=Sphagnum jensenii TaxID=128206 RepID=A0ABP1BXM9_9BRYO